MTTREQISAASAVAPAAAISAARMRSAGSACRCCSASDPMMRFRTQLELNEWWHKLRNREHGRVLSASRCACSRTRRRKFSSRTRKLEQRGVSRGELCVRAMRGRGLAAELLRVEWGDHVAHNFNPIVAGASGVAIPRATEHICRVAVDVSPRVRSAHGLWQT